MPANSYSRASANRSPRPRSSAGHSGFGPRTEWSGRPEPAGRSPAGRAPANRAPAKRGGLVKQYIDPRRFTVAARPVAQVEYVPVHTWTDFDLHSRLLDNLKAKGYTQPTPIQDQTIPLARAGRDVVGIANTGTGKTAAFALPLLHDLITHMDHRAIIMAPTRELAQQIMDECFSFGKGCGLRSALLIGGASMHLQKRDLRFNPRVVVGTPGRIQDHVRQGTLMLPLFNLVVLDEVDRMLDMGFLPAIDGILRQVAAERQSLFFSATMEPKIAKLIERYAKSPATVTVSTGATADGVEQGVVYYSGTTDKLDKLHNLLIGADRGRTIIFDDTKRAVERLERELADRGFRVDALHGDKNQSQRARALRRLKSDEIDILVATDVAARGLDVDEVSHVINFNQPNSYEDYVHRIGRTGRAGRTGQAFTFLPR
jgi:superfamily II DNA/RNA helicase